MAPLTGIAALLTLALFSYAEIISLRPSTNHPLITDLQRHQQDYRFLPPIPSKAESTDGTDLKLLDIVLLASVDGQFHALDRKSGQKLWSMTPPTADSVPTGLGPLVRTQHVKPDPDLVDEDDPQHSELYIIEPQSGNIFVMPTPNSPLQRLPYPMARLVEMSPLSIADEHAKRIFVGKKETTLLVVELETGRVKAKINSECPWDPFEELAVNDSEDLDLDELDGTKPPKDVSTSTEVFIGRTDYHISIHTRPKDPSVPRPPVQHLSFSTYGPNKGDISIQDVYRRTEDDSYIQPLPNGEILAFKAPEIRAGPEKPFNPYLWSYKFKEPIVAVFDILHSPSRPNPLVLLQPKPRLQNIYPHVDLSSESALQNLPNIDSAYVGMVSQTGALFAMSPETYPFMTFRFSDSNTQVHNLLDASPGSYVPAGEDVDSITRARKTREICSGPNPDYFCFTGLRRLEASDRSRYSRLIEGGPPSAPNESEKLTHSTTSAPAPSHTPFLIDSPGSLYPDFARTSFVTFVSAPITLAALLIGGWFAWKHRRNGESLRIETFVPASVFPPGIIPGDSMSQESKPAPADKPPTPESEQASSRVSEQAPTPTPPTRKSVSIMEPVPSPDDDGEGDDSEKEGDNQAAPGRRKRRGRRAKKKKSTSANPEDSEETAGQETIPNKPQPVPSIITPTLPSAMPSPSLVVSDTILGFGSHGTVVFQGSLQGRAVAVKRLLQDFVTLASREVSILQESDDHPNVIRYYYQEAHANFLYIALELCPASLADIVESPDQFRDISVTFNPKRALRQVTSGLRHLHNLKIIHRDIKPQNILIASPKGGTSSRDGGHRMLISDFGLCKKLEVDQTSFLPTAHGSMAAGTVGWRAPEILRGEVKLDDTIGDDTSQSSRGSVGGTSSYPGKLTRLTKSVDIFALGCLFYYTLTNGCHPFGDRFEREVNILRNEKNLDALTRFGEEGSEATDLITAMLDPEAKLRPDTTTCLLHPYFWEPARRLTFLQDASDRFEIMCRDPRDPNLVELETGAFDVVGNDWLSRLDKAFLENLGKFRKYDGRSVQDLLRALRNKKHHYQDLPEHVKRNLGAMPEGFLAYFTRRFPMLFLHVHGVVSRTSLHQESMFRSYFELAEP